MTQVHFWPSKPLHSWAVPALDGCTEGSRSEPNDCVEAACAELALNASAVATIVAASRTRAISEVRVLGWVMVVLRFMSVFLCLMLAGRVRSGSNRIGSL